MCQKAFGGFFGPLVTAHEAAWTRGRPKYFRSFNRAQPGFCGDFGTQLVYDSFEPDGSIELAIGAFDDPLVAAPASRAHPNDKLAFFDGLAGLRLRTPQGLASMAEVRPCQHPDQNTGRWPRQEPA
jgi:hypothetical protein